MSILRENQAGFLTGRSCVDQIHNLRCVLQQSNVFNSSLACCFVDYEKGFDSPHRSSLWNILKLYGIPTKIVAIIKCLHEESECCIRIGDLTTEWFGVSTGVRQGCVLDPFLFIVIFDFILRKSIPPDRDVTVAPNLKLCDLEYADDAVIFDKSFEGIQETIDRLQSNLFRIGLKINVSKTNVLCNNACPDPHYPLTSAGQNIERVDGFMYLGVHITGDGSTPVPLVQRMHLDSAALRRESWHLMEAQSNRILCFENRCLRRMLGVIWSGFVRNTEIRKRTNQPLITSKIKKQR